MQQTQPTIPVFLSLQEGLRLLSAQVRPFLLLSNLSFILFVLSLALPRLLPFQVSEAWGALSMLPAAFFQAATLAIILRWVLLGEHPLSYRGVESLPQRRVRNAAMKESALASTALTALYNGFLLLMFYAMRPAIIAAQNGVPVSPVLSILALLALGVFVYAARFFWLPVPLALGWNVQGFFNHLGTTFAVSVRIFAIFMLSALVGALPFDLLRSVFITAMNTQQPSVAFILLDSILAAASNVAVGLVFTCATAACVRYLLETRKGGTIV